MSQTLYEEAIAEARRLTEMAEQNAKNKIIEAVTPQIKRLIEQELMGSDSLNEEDLIPPPADPDDVEDEEEDEEDEDEEAEETEAGADMSSVIDLDRLSAASPAPRAKSPASPVSSLEVHEDGVELTVGDVKVSVERELDDEEMVAEALKRSLGKSSSKILPEIKSLSNKFKVLKRAISEAKQSGTDHQKTRIANIFESLARDAVKLQRQVILTERSRGGLPLETKLLSSIIKEMKDMTRRSNRNVFDFLFEAEEDKKDDEKMEMPDIEVEPDMGGAGGAGGVDSDRVKSALEDLLAAAGVEGLDIEVTGGGKPADDEEPADEDADESSDDEEPTDEDDVLKEMGSYHEVENLGEVEDEREEEPEGEGLAEFHINEADLRRELNRLRRLSESDAVSGSGASSFGGGKATDDMFVDVDEETLLNALADELGTVKKVKAAKMMEARRASSARVNESAVLRRQVADYRSVAEQLKGQLVEMNLFNAKLLYANKLMQNRDLSAKQQRAIVEALDNAKTLREAKLLYKSLTEAHNRTVNRGSLTEGRNPRVLGSSSKSARSGQPIAEGAAGGVDRWALLAGIKKD